MPENVIPNSDARHLMEGDRYRALDGVEHTVATVGVLSHRVNVTHTDGTYRALSTTARVEIAA